MPNLIDVDVLSSYARRVGDQVRVVLVLPAEASLDPATQPQTWLRFEVDTDSVDLPTPTGWSESDGLAFRVPATVTADPAGWRVEALAPRDQLPAGLWKLRVRPGSDPLLFLRARLLTSDTQPIALLPGPRPATSMAPPAPRVAG